MSKTYRVPMIFPGQASQAVGMAHDLAQAGGPAADFLATVNEALGGDLTGIMSEGPAETLTETHNAQPAILAHSVAITLALKALGIEPSLVAGHSLGDRYRGTISDVSHDNRCFAASVSRSKRNETSVGRNPGIELAAICHGNREFLLGR